MPRPSPVPTRPEDILCAARTVFATRGFLDARMADIAVQAQIATGTIYLYYPSKEALLSALVEDYFVRLTALLQPFVNMEYTPANLARAVHTVLEYLSQERDLLALARLQTGLKEGGKQEFGPAQRRFLDTLSRDLHANMEQQRLRRYDSQALAEIINALFSWIAEACFVRETAEIARYEQTLVHFLQHALLLEQGA